MAADIRRDVGADANWHADDDEIGAGDGFGIRGRHPLSEPDLGGAGSHLGGGIGHHQFAGEAELADGARDRRADQAEADQGDALELRRHGHLSVP